MVKSLKENNKELYQCEECSFKYEDNIWAEKCEKWCKEHKSCNIEITSHAVPLSGMGQMSKKERKEERRAEKERAKQKLRFQRRVKKLSLWTAIAVLAGLGLLAGWKWLSSQPAPPKSELISTSGIHWHPHLSIKILGEEQKIPGGIGLGIAENPIHTHNPDGIIHLEFAGRVTENDVRLGRFFQVWGKTFNKDCIFDKCSGPEGQLKMLVNGKENFDFENYIMRDRDQIEIIYE